MTPPPSTAMGPSCLADNRPCSGRKKRKHIQTTFSIFKGSSFLMTDSSNPGSGNYDFHRSSATRNQDNDPTAPLWDGPSGNSWANSNILNGTTTVNGVVADWSATPMPTASNNGFNLVAVQMTGPVTADSWNFDRNGVHYAGNGGSGSRSRAR